MQCVMCRVQRRQEWQPPTKSNRSDNHNSFLLLGNGKCITCSMLKKAPHKRTIPGPVLHLFPPFGSPQA
eukprot:1144640-Pelagomonas_calceolata.AAC.2